MVSLLLFITSLVGGGAERVVSELSLHLPPSIHRRVVTLVDEWEYPVNELPISLHVPILRPHILGVPYAILQGMIRYRRFVRHYRPDISMSFLVLDNFVNILANRKNPGVKVVVQVHIALSMKFRYNYPARYLVKRLYKQADLVIAVSHGVREELIREFGIPEGRVRVLYNPNDLTTIAAMAAEGVEDPWFQGDIPLILTMGRLAPQKGQWHLLRAFAHVRKAIPCRLVIRGEGELRPYLDSLIRELHLEGEVKFLGWDPNPFRYIARASIFVLPSLWEALPYALIEAMACGCPVVATDCPYGPREVLGESEYGILLPPLDGRQYRASDPLTVGEENLARVLVALLNDRELREAYARTGRERALLFDKDKSLREYEQVLTSLISPGAEGRGVTINPR